MCMYVQTQLYNIQGRGHNSLVVQWFNKPENEWRIKKSMTKLKLAHLVNISNYWKLDSEKELHNHRHFVARQIHN